MDQLKHNKKALLWLIAIDLALAISSNVVDWPWLIRVPHQFVIFAPICSLYPTLLTFWFVIYYFKKKVPSWFTTFIFMGIVGYGIMAYIYYPLYMSWSGVNFHDIGSIFWVTAYAIQALIIMSEMKKMHWLAYVLIFGYFYFKDYADRYLGTFLDVLLDSYPENLKTLFITSVLMVHTALVAFVLTWTLKPKEKQPITD